MAFLLISALTGNLIIVRIIFQNTVFHKFGLHILFALLSLAILFFNYRYGRSSSYDGRYFHHKVVYSIIKTGSYKPLYEDVKPYWLEYVLGFAGRAFGENSVGLLFGFATILSLYTLFRIYRYLNLSSKEIIILGTVLFSSPLFMGLSFFEYKIDIFLLFIIQVLYISIYKLLKTGQKRYYLLAALISGFAILTKLSSLPVAGTAFLCAFYIYLGKYKKTQVLTHIVAVILVLAPYLSWVLINGALLPVIQVPIGFRPKALFNVNPDITRTCQAEIKNNDYEAYIYGTGSFLALGQPFFYLSGYNMTSDGRQAIATLGPVLYLFIFVSMPWPFFRKIEKTEYEKVLYVVMVIHIVAYYALIKSVFWYLFPVLPLCIYFSYQVVKKNIDTGLLKFVLTFIVANSFVLWLIYSVTHYIPEIYNEALTERMDRNFAKKITEITGNGLILDASYQQWGVVYPYLLGSDKKIVRANFLFSDDRYFDMIKTTEVFKNAGIEYIICPDFEKYSANAPCITRYKENLNKYLLLYTDLVYKDSLNYNLYKIR